MKNLHWSLEKITLTKKKNLLKRFLKNLDKSTQKSSYKIKF